jgi:hypothetical protein
MLAAPYTLGRTRTQAMFAHMSPGQSRSLACDVPAGRLGHRSQKQLSVFNIELD